MPLEHRQEVAALARAAHVDVAELLRANAVVDACCCTAFAATGEATGGAPLLVGRNLDFAPSDVLGRRTLVQVIRTEGMRAFASIGFPGFSAVASGMNEDGLVAAILINKDAKPRAKGIPLGFLVRRLLERCRTVDEARALFHEQAPASGHFVFLADEKAAAVVTRDAEDRVLVAREGLLWSTNGPWETNDRAVATHALLERSFGRIDADEARRILAAVYLPREATQSMVFEPAARAIHVARGSTFAPAPLEPWVRVELREAFRGGDVRVSADRALTGVPEHYQSKDWAETLREAPTR